MKKSHVKWMVWWIALWAASSCGCASGEAIPPLALDMTPPDQPVVEAVPAPAAVPHVPECGAILTVMSPELQPYVEQAAARWQAAIGCPVTVGDGGVPITLLDHVYDADNSDKEVIGLTDIYRDDNDAFWGPIDTFISRQTKEPEVTVAHEVGHILGAMTHTAGGIMHAWLLRPIELNVIDGDALADVCASVACTIMKPE